MRNMKIAIERVETSLGEEWLVRVQDGRKLKLLTTTPTLREAFKLARRFTPHMVVEQDLSGGGGGPRPGEVEEALRGEEPDA